MLRETLEKIESNYCEIEHKSENKNETFINTTQLNWITSRFKVKQTHYHTTKTTNKLIHLKMKMIDT